MSNKSTTATSRISTYLTIIVLIVMAMSIVALLLAVNALMVGNEMVAGYLMIVGLIAMALSVYVLLQSKKRAARRKIEAPKVMTTIECPKCRSPMGIGPTSQKVICVGCEGQFDIVRIPVGSEQSDAICKGTSVTKNIPPIIQDVKELYHYAKGYAHLEMIYDLIGQPFDSTLMDKLLMHTGLWLPKLDEPDSWLPYLALGIEDSKEFKEKIRRLADERAHNKEG